MLICDHRFHAVLLRQSFGRRRKILEKPKNTDKRMSALGLCITLCVSVCVCVDYICVLLCLVVYMIVSMCVCV